MKSFLSTKQLSHRVVVHIDFQSLSQSQHESLVFWKFLIDVINRTHSKSIFSKRLLSVPKKIKWRDFANSSYLSMLFSGNWNPAWKSTFTSDTTQILSFHVSEAKWCSFWWLKEKVKGSFGSRILVFGVWIPSLWLYVLRSCRADETFFSSYEQQLAHTHVKRKLLFLATLHLKRGGGGVHKFIIVHTLLCVWVT